MTEPDDADLWRRIRADDADAFGLLFQRHGPRIHGYALRRTGDPAGADDVVAMVFLEVWRQRRTVDLHQASALPWLYGVAGNVLRRRQRTAHRHRGALDRLASLPPAHAALVDRQAEAAADAAAVLDQVRHLPRREREVLVLSVWEGLSHAEIAEALGTSAAAVKSRLARARARLDPDRRPVGDEPLPSAAPAPRAPAVPTTLALKES